MERDAVLRGLAENPAVPAETLVRLLAGDSPEPVARGLRERTDLSPALQAAMEAHPYLLVRAVLAGHPRADPGIRDGCSTTRTGGCARGDSTAATNRRCPMRG